jgi:hypothetical protein
MPHKTYQNYIFLTEFIKDFDVGDFYIKKQAQSPVLGGLLCICTAWSLYCPPSPIPCLAPPPPLASAQSGGRGGAAYWALHFLALCK